MSNITLNIVEPGSPTPIDPSVPNTGLFTGGTGAPEATIIATVSIVILLAIITFFIIRKKKGMTKLSKRTTISLSTIALLVSAGTFIALARNAVNATDTDEQAESENDNSLTVDVSSTELTIELADEPVFAVLPVDITVEEATLAGYTLIASTNNISLVSTTDSSKVIPMVAADEGELVALANNTYGLALEEKPTTKDEAVYTALSTDSSNPTILKAIDDYSSTPANDTTTIYYGFYITPDTPYGIYTGSNINVDAIPNIATVTYNANGLYFNDSEEDTTNTVGYKPNIAEAPIEEVVGEYITPTPLTPVDPSTTIHYTFLGWSEDKSATTPTYTNEEDILANLTLTKNESLTLYAVWHYNTVLSFNGTTSDVGTPMEDITIPAGNTITLPHNTYTRTGSVFTGWNTAADGSGEAYADEADFTAPNESADITLYAQWAYYTTITFNGNGADSGYMSPQDIIAGTPENLTPNAFVRTNATFIGWNTQANGSGTSYTDEAEFIASTEQHQDITLYAQWAYTTISFNGNTSDSGTMNPITIAGGTTSNLPAKAFTKNNCIFTGWNTAANGTGISYGDSTPYQANATTIEAFTLYAQWQCISQVNYYGNGATSGEMASSIILGGSTLTLSQNAYTKDGYAFNGWNTQADGTGTSYPDQGTFTAPMTQATTLNLYAQWKQVFYMQDVATWGSTLSQGDTMEALDSRDGKSYWVAKLADGNIWMTQNLDLDIEAGRTYTSADTDLANSTISTSWTPTVSTNTTSSWTSSSTAPSSYNPGNLYWDGTLNTSWNGNLSNETVTDPSSTSGGTHYHIGNYYNWTAAVAMNDSNGKNSGDMNQSICPASWRLPTYSGDKSYQNLVNAQNLTAGTSGNIQNTPTYFVYGGYWDGNSYDVGSDGYYWSSVVSSSSKAYQLTFYASGDLYPQYSTSRNVGYSLRCVAR